jgi:hypothetical protein
MYELRAKRLDAQKAVDQLRVEEDEYESHILNTFTKADLRGAKGDLATAGVKRTRVFNIVDWDVFLADVKKKKAWDCLQKRLATTAIADREAAGKPMAGVESFEKVSLSLNKAGAA